MTVWLNSRMTVLTSEIIQARLGETIPQATVQVEDPRGDGQYLIVTVSSASFAGLTTIEQHRLVYKALGEPSIDPPPTLSLCTRIVKTAE